MLAQEKTGENFDRLETGPRDLVQAHLLIDLFGEGADAEHLAWIDAYSKTASDIMDGDSEESQAIRAIARSGDYQTAAQLLLALLPPSARNIVPRTKAA